MSLTNPRSDEPGASDSGVSLTSESLPAESPAGEIDPSMYAMQCMEVWGGNRAIDTGVRMPGLDAWVYSRPYGSEKAADPSQVGGGDIHYVTSCNTGRITRLCIADVSGHGEKVSKAAIALRKLMGKFSNYVDQTRFVEELNRKFSDIASEEGEEVVTGSFATAVVASFFAPGDELSICNAGHPHPAKYNAAERRWELLTPTTSDDAGLANLPLGVLSPTRYPSASIPFLPGDIVLFYTDSLIEARLVGGGMLGLKGLLEVLNGLGKPNPKNLIPKLLEKITERSLNAVIFDDDVTALLIQRNARAPKPSVALSVVGLTHMLKNTILSMFPGGPPLSLPEMSIPVIGGSLSARLHRWRSRPRQGP